MNRTGVQEVNHINSYSIVYDVKTAILGGGLTGLTLARFLLERGEEVVVLEAEPAIGGLCRSRREQGFCFDTGGSHIIFSRDEEVLRFMLSDELNGLLLFGLTIEV